MVGTEKNSIKIQCRRLSRLSNRVELGRNIVLIINKKALVGLSF